MLTDIYNYDCITRKTPQEQSKYYIWYEYFFYFYLNAT